MLTQVTNFMSASARKPSDLECPRTVLLCVDLSHRDFAVAENGRGGIKPELTSHLSASAVAKAIRRPVLNSRRLRSAGNRTCVNGTGVTRPRDATLALGLRPIGFPRSIPAT